MQGVLKICGVLLSLLPAVTAAQSTEYTRRLTGTIDRNRFAAILVPLM